jgi:hypothetical protein
MMAAIFSMLEQDVHMQVVHPCFVPFGLAPCYFLQTLSLCWNFELCVLLNRSKLLVPLGSICLQKFFRTIAWCGHSDHLWMKQWWIKLLVGSGHSTLAFILIPLPSCLSPAPPNNDFALTCYMFLSFSLMLSLANGSIVDHQAGSVLCWFMDFESQPDLNSRGCAKTK